MAEENENTEQKHPGPGQPTLYNDAMPAIVDLFLKKSIHEGKLPTHAGLAVFLGVCKATIGNWAKIHPEFLASLGKLNATQEDMLVNSGLKSEYNSTICKLMLSSNHGYCERTDTTTKGEKIEPKVVSFLDAIKPAEQETEKPESTDDVSE